MAMRKCKVFIIDDEPKILRFISANLKSLGYEAYIFQNGTDALANFDVLDPELILLDIMMPELDGLEVLKRREHFPMCLSLF